MRNARASTPSTFDPKDTASMLQFLVESVSRLEKNSATKDDLTRMATKDDLATLEKRMATKDDLAVIRKTMATKDDILELKDEMADMEIRIGHQLSDVRQDLTLHMQQLFESAHDHVCTEGEERQKLESRVTKLEHKVFA